MQLYNYSLKVKNKLLLSNVNIKFESGVINHLLGKNGVGKSCFAKSILGVFPYKGEIKTNAKSIVAIGSYTNLPLDLLGQDILDLTRRLYKKETVDYLFNLLNIGDIPLNNRLKNLSDGQKQKLKLLYFLSKEPELIILDEFTNALDKKTSMDIYKFLNTFLKQGNITSINITHNLSDLEYMEGNYYLIEDQNIISGLSKEEIINYYIKGE
ncbi:ATP-binding cassette domain-containing protein [Defluviitalea phaphyphila]|uniref:ATP-binding cassette domain-containing protein n=1 Tax=Defluviitalea phaphyphila TaxID=1473580 RepID=UPI0007306640|nr:ATP-binding cassette domain-containing protein [Defluviitalea phaphyphila]